MRFPKLTIEKKPPKKKRRRTEKTRQFTVTLLGYVCADGLWEHGTAKSKRPIWIAYAGPDQTCRSFTANFRAGRKAKADGEPFEVPKSSSHRWLTDRKGETAITVAYLPDLFHLEPTVHPEDITFAFMPPQWWLDRQTELLRPQFRHDSPELARAALFTAFLDRRSPLPIVHDLRFQLDLYREALRQPWLRSLDSSAAERLEACGLAPPLFCCVTHQHFEEFLKDRTNAFFAQEIRDGKNRFPPDCRLLPYPSPDPVQLRLDFAVG